MEFLINNQSNTDKKILHQGDIRFIQVFVNQIEFDDIESLSFSLIGKSNPVVFVSFPNDQYQKLSHVRNIHTDDQALEDKINHVQMEAVLRKKPINPDWFIKISYELLQ